MSKRRKQDRVLTSKVGRHYRKTYSLTEVKVGGVVALLLGGGAAWVGWMGAHPDPELFKAAPGQIGAAAEVDRGGPPEGSAPDGGTERSVASGGPDNVYEKSHGREGFYKSFGFVSLSFASYLDPDDETRGVDIEAYDLGEAANAVGCLTAEAGPARPPTVRDGALIRIEPNARFLARDRIYLRLIASDDSEASNAALDHLEARLVASLEAGELPWAFGLLVGELGLDPGQVSYIPEDAFSLAAGERVHAAELDADGTTLFVTVAGDAADDVAAAFLDGFSVIGERIDGPDGRTWVQDRYQKRVSTAVAAAPPFVAGVHSARDVESVAPRLDALLRALALLSPGLRDRALAELPKEVDPAPPSSQGEEAEGPAPESEESDPYDEYEE